MLGFGKSIRPNEIDAVISKFTNCFDIIKEKQCWRLQIKRGFPRVFDSDDDVLTYWKHSGEVDIFTAFHLVLNSDNDFGYEFFANLETKNIKAVEEHLTRMAAFLLSTQHLEGTYLAEIKKEKSRIKIDELKKDFK